MRARAQAHARRPALLGCATTDTLFLKVYFDPADETSACALQLSTAKAVDESYRNVVLGQAKIRPFEKDRLCSSSQNQTAVERQNTSYGLSERFVYATASGSLSPWF